MASLCTKCQQRATVYDVGGSKCDYCFQQAIIHNLKTTVSRKGLARFGDSVGLAASGGYASQALIDLLGRSLSEREDGKTTRMKLQVTVFHVDCETPLLQSSEKSRKVIEQLAAKYSFRVCYASEYMSSHQSLKETWERLAWSDVSDISDLEELSRIAVYRMIAILASSHGCKIVFDGLNANSICRNILTNISSGNGFAIPFEVSPIDISGRFSQVSIHHPQRDITDRQLMRYIWIRKVDFVAPNLLLQPVSSVESLTVSFLKELEVEHRSTIPNILRTSSKMEVPLQFSYCSFCRVPVGSNGKLLSTCPDIRLCKACQYRQERMSSNAFQLFLSSFMTMDQLSQ